MLITDSGQPTSADSPETVPATVHEYGEELLDIGTLALVTTWLSVGVLVSTVLVLLYASHGSAEALPIYVIPER